MKPRLDKSGPQGKLAHSEVLKFLRDFVIGILAALVAAWIWTWLESPQVIETAIPSHASQSITITQIPRRLPLGQSWPSRWIRGNVRGVGDPKEYRVAVYSYTNMWYVQPTLEQPLTGITPTGQWQSYIQGGDYYAALLVKAEFVPPPKTRSLPTDLPEVTTWNVVEGKSNFLLYYSTAFGVFLTSYVIYRIISGRAKAPDSERKTKRRNDHLL